MECKTSFQRLITIQTPSILYNKLDRTGKKYKHRMDLSYNLFKGASFRLEDLTSEEELAKQIADMPEIKQMWPVREYPVPKDEVICCTGVFQLHQQASVFRQHHVLASCDDPGRPPSCGGC
jgi:hypothetical protein